MHAKEKCAIVTIQFTEPTLVTLEEVNLSFDHADLIIEYKSFYDEKFTYSSEVERANNLNHT